MIYPARVIYLCSLALFGPRSLSFSFSLSLSSLHFVLSYFLVLVGPARVRVLKLNWISFVRGRGGFGRGAERKLFPPAAVSKELRGTCGAVCYVGAYTLYIIYIYTYIRVLLHYLLLRFYDNCREENRTRADGG